MRAATHSLGLVFFALALSGGCAPASRLASLQQTVVITDGGNDRLEARLQPGVQPAGPLSVSVAIENTSPSAADIEKVTATLATADGGLLAEQSLSEGLTVEARTSERRHMEFTGPWPDDAVIVVWTYRRGVDGKLKRVGSCTPLCLSCDAERTHLACEIETRAWTD